MLIPLVLTDLGLLQLPDAQRQGDQQQQDVEHNDQRSDPSPPVTTGAGHVDIKPPQGLSVRPQLTHFTGQLLTLTLHTSSALSLFDQLVATSHSHADRYTQ